MSVFSDVSPHLIPILGILIPIVATVGHFINEAHRRSALQDTVQKLIERGQVVPPELLKAISGQDLLKQQEAADQASYRGPLSFLAVGLGLMVFLYLFRPGEGIWALGLIPTFLGIAQMVAMKLDARTPPR